MSKTLERVPELKWTEDHLGTEPDPPLFDVLAVARPLLLLAACAWLLFGAGTLAAWILLSCWLASTLVLAGLRRRDDAG